MSVIVTDIPPSVMRSRLHEGLRVYTAAMAYPRGIEYSRAPMWAEHILRAGWRAVAAFDTSATAAGTGTRDFPVRDDPTIPLVGIAYGYRGAPAYWWDRQVRAGLTDSGRSTAVLGDYFELTELHVLPSAQGSGIGRRLLTRLLDGTGRERVLLSTPEVPGEGNRAWRLYRRAGFSDVLRGFRFLGDDRAFAVLGRPLPLTDDHPSARPH